MNKCTKIQYRYLSRMLNNILLRSRRKRHPKTRLFCLIIFRVLNIEEERKKDAFLSVNIKLSIHTKLNTFPAEKSNPGSFLPGRGLVDCDICMGEGLCYDTGESVFGIVLFLSRCCTVRRLFPTGKESK